MTKEDYFNQCREISYRRPASYTIPTEIKDINNREIQIGDFIEWEPYMSEGKRIKSLVLWSKKKKTIFVRQPYYFDHPLAYNVDLMGYNIVIIGNINQNLELEKELFPRGDEHIKVGTFPVSEEEF